MTASNEGIAKFISTLRLYLRVPIYEPNKDAKEVAWTKSIADVVRFYDDELLERAAKRILDKPNSRREFPLPGDIRRTIDEIVREDNATKLALDGPRDDRTSSYSRDRVALAYELLRTEAGRRAADEGWAADFHMFVRRNGRAPNNNERKPHTIVKRGVGGKLYRDRVMCTEVEALRAGKEPDLRPDLIRMLDERTGHAGQTAMLLRFAESMQQREREMATAAREPR